MFDQEWHSLPSIMRECLTVYHYPGKRSQLEVWFLKNTYHFCTIVKSKDHESNVTLGPGCIFFLSYGWTVLYHPDIPHFVYNGHLDSSNFLAVVISNNAAVSIHIQNFVWRYVFISLGWILKSSAFPGGPLLPPCETASKMVHWPVRSCEVHRWSLGNTHALVGFPATSLPLWLLGSQPLSPLIQGQSLKCSIVSQRSCSHETWGGRMSETPHLLHVCLLGGEWQQGLLKKKKKKILLKSS